mgnify:CR=1 FL=1
MRLYIYIYTWTRGTPFRVWAHHTCIKIVSKYERQSHSTFCFKQTHKPHLSICTVNKPHKTHFFHRDLCSALIESNKVLCCRSQKVDMDSFVSHFLKINISWKKYPLKTVISQVKRDQSCYFSTTSFQCSDRVDLKRRLYISKNDIINIYSTFAQK